MALRTRPFLLSASGLRGGGRSYGIHKALRRGCAAPLQLCAVAAAAAPRSEPTAAVAAWALGAPAVCPDRPSMRPNSRRIRLFRSAARDCREFSPRRGRQLLFTAQTSTGARQCKLVASCSGGVRMGACSTCFLLVKPCTWSRARSRCVGEAILLCSSGSLDSLDSTLRSRSA